MKRRKGKKEREGDRLERKRRGGRGRRRERRGKKEGGKGWRICRS